jgi:hypothetical protein
VSVRVGDDTIGNPGECRKTSPQSLAAKRRSAFDLVAAIAEAHFMGSTASDSMSHCIHHASHAIDK